MYLLLAGVFLTLAAAVGTNPLWQLIRKLPAKMKFVWIHGGLAAMGVTFLILQATQSAKPTPWLSVMILFITFLGGVGLFALRRMKAPVPAGIALIHPLAGVVGLVLLFQALFAK
ncbi:MAG: hypothetical protein H6505_02590 [Calditrichaeota bacterium]|nr:hypothetical protein [Calditrichota bacterium]